MANMPKFSIKIEHTRRNWLTPILILSIYSLEGEKGGGGKREKWDNGRKESIEMGEGEGREGEEKDRVNRGSLYVDFIGFVIVM